MHCPNFYQWRENGSCLLVLDGTSLFQIKHAYIECDKKCLHRCIEPGGPLRVMMTLFEEHLSSS